MTRGTKYLRDFVGFCCSAEDVVQVADTAVVVMEHCCKDAGQQTKRKQEGGEPRSQGVHAREGHGSSRQSERNTRNSHLSCLKAAKKSNHDTAASCREIDAGRNLKGT